MNSRCVLAVLVALVMPVFSQQTDSGASKQQKIAALKQSLAHNQAELKKYAWTETTQVSLKGEVKKQERKQCQYGPDGKVQKVPLQDPSAPQQQTPQESGRRRGAMLKKRIVEKKVGEMKDYMERVEGLVHQYVPPNADRVQAAAAAGNVSVDRGQPVSSITISNYLKQGDSVVLGFDAQAKSIVSYNVNSYLDNPKDDAVKLAVTFAKLPQGINYVQQTVLDATGKKIEVHVTNSDYKKIGQ